MRNIGVPEVLLYGILGVTIQSPSRSRDTYQGPFVFYKLKLLPHYAITLPKTFGVS